MIVLGVAGAFSSGDDDDGEATTTTNAANSGVLTRVAMKPQGSAEGSGTVIIGLDPADSQPYVDLALNGLEAPSQKEAYVAWILLSADQAYPLTFVVPCSSTVSQPCLSENGRYRDRLAIEPGVLALVARVRFVEVSIAPVKEITQAVNQAVEDETIIVNRPGTTVLRGVVSAGRDGGGGAGGGG